MPNGPQRLVLINAGRYDYADVELRGSLQIVGPNNTGKTTLINALQFLYLDDQRYMEFGSYSSDQTRSYYFPNQYSYILFEVLGASGKCVIGWRGQSRVVAGEPERFVFDGPFDSNDFLTPDHQVREPRDINSRLSLKNYKLLRNAQEHRELLLLATRGDSKGIGLIALRDNDRYPHFRQTLKSLLCLSTISQDQMRAQLLMLAGFSTDRHALDIRELFGNDYDRILGQKQKLVRFKKQQKEIELLVDASARREANRAELATRWEDLRAKSQASKENHKKNVERLTTEAKNAAQRLHDLGKQIDKHRSSKDELVETKGSISGKVTNLEEQHSEFAGFTEDLARNALTNLREDMRRLEELLRTTEKTPRDKAELKRHNCQETVNRTLHAIKHFDRALITVLRQRLAEEELASLGGLFNFDIFEQTVGKGGVLLHSTTQLAQLLRRVARRIKNNVYEDDVISLPLPPNRRPFAELANVSGLRERLTEEEATLRQCHEILHAIDQRESLLTQISAKRQQIDGTKDFQGREIVEGLAKQLFRFEEYQRTKDTLPQLRAQLKEKVDAIRAEEEQIQSLSRKQDQSRSDESTAKGKIAEEQNDFAKLADKFNQCIAPDFSINYPQTEKQFSEEFSTCIEEYRSLHSALNDLNSQITAILGRLEATLGPDYTGVDDLDTIQRFREELEALPERENVLRRDWEHQLTGLQATFDQILRSLADIKSAADRLNRDFSSIQVSNLATLSMQVQEQTDNVGSIRRLAKVAQPGLFDESTGLEETIANFRKKFEASPILHYQDLFTLQFTVTGDDGKAHHYQDFRQVESHGTTITIKVLFNLLMLRSLLREDSQKNLHCEIPFFLDEIHSLDAINRHAILTTARKLGFIAITAAPESVSEVDALYFLQPQQGRIVLRNSHRLSVLSRKRGA